ncbi:integral membrane sensor hybrid histidine kinase [Niastella koreensis GR20-10]|uniref:histidine kinase n=2 Tax=Niastella koreensis TaxID=354356 RepID=G8TIV4_NIAKG|nr:ATP-binding protein [Niastella koreensis]AEV96448.1 integral membrane sensor hybrid histidine kinase [Niastella koreensis GR20-10]
MMSGKRIIFYILAAFLAGTIVLIYVEYNSTKHLNSLIKANRKLMGEFRITENMLNATKSKVVIERKIRGFIESGDTSYLTGLNVEFEEIQRSQQFLMAIPGDSHTVALIHKLDTTIQKKINLFHNVLHAYHRHSVQAAEDTIKANLPEWVSYDIESTVRDVTEARRDELAVITNSVQRSGQKALEFSYMLIALVLLATGVLLWYILHIMQKLIRSEKKVRETARVKENFLANMSHEIRTPMNAILGFTQLLSQKRMDDDAKHFVTTIQSSGENLLTIVNDILDISKIEAGMMRIEKLPFSLRGLVNSIELMVQQKVMSKSISLTIAIDNSLPDILEGDPVRLTQIINNLLGNAIKFTEKGAIDLRIIKKEIIDNIVTLQFVIRDTGIGIEPQKLKEIFGRFQQADDTITRQYGGTGLGLSIVKDLVDLLKGTITVESTPGTGTAFTITLPYFISTQQIRNNLGISELPIANNTHTNLHILITEDNEANQSLLSHIFRNWNIPFAIANNGQEAIELLKKKEFNLVLMDIQMPVMDGYTAARKIRNELKLTVPIVAMTAHALPGEKEKCLSYGMNDYITKPVKQDQLRDLINRFTSFAQPVVKTETPKPSEETNNYNFIQLDYLKDVSAGNKNYEKDVTQKFLQAVPVALQQLEMALQEGNTDAMKRIAHNLKTTISVMGLNDTLNPLLDEVEAGNRDNTQLRNTLHKITDTCRQAMAEAKQFHASLL